MDSVLGLDLKVAMVVSLCVIVFCVTSGLVLIVCCFWSQCPMYDTCSGSWDKNSTAVTPDMMFGAMQVNDEADLTTEETLVKATKDQNGGHTVTVVLSSSKDKILQDQDVQCDENQV